MLIRILHYMLYKNSLGGLYRRSVLGFDFLSSLIEISSLFFYGHFGASLLHSSQLQALQWLSADDRMGAWAGYWGCGWVVPPILQAAVMAFKSRTCVAIVVMAKTHAENAKNTRGKRNFVP